MPHYQIPIYMILCASVILDIATGIAQAVANQSLDSTVLRNGLFHKLSYFFAVMLALLLEWACNYLDLGFSIELFIPLAAYIVITESISVLENIVRLNPELRESPIFKLLSSTQNRRSTDNAKGN